MKMKYQGVFMLSDIIYYCLAGLFFLAIAWVGLSAYLDASKNNRARADTAMLAGRISQYRFEVGSYPASLANLQNAVGQYGPWIHDLPEDPWSHGHSYSYITDANSCVVFSVGKNGASNSTVAAGIGGDDVGYYVRQ